MKTIRVLATPGAEAYDFPLLIRHLLAGTGQHADSEIVSAGRRFSYAEFVERIHRLAGLLSSLGVGAGDTVAMMDWDSHRYLEAYFAVPMMGAVLQTVNVRLSREQIAFTLRQSGASFLMRHADFEALCDELLPDLPDIAHCLPLADSDEPGSYEALIAAASPDFAFADFDERAVATTFHTTGTTGDPKQVFFSHRQLVLHTLGLAAALANQPDGQGLRRDDVYMPITPMFHVHAWGMPYVATMLGLKQIYPGRYEPSTLIRLKRDEGVTFSHCVPTILRMILDAARGEAADGLGPWTMVIGGSALPPALAEEAERAGIVALSGYGMSETGPVVALSRTRKGEPVALRCRAGLTIPLVDARVDPDNGGELQLRAPWLTQGYGTQEASDALWEGGWLHTGDIAEIDEDGGIRLVDRLKDVIKTGGEWISSLALEALIVEHPDVAEVAVIGVPDARWGERPLAFVVVAPDAAELSLEALRAHLGSHAEAGRISRFAIPERLVHLPALPRTSVGKIDKKSLKQRAPA